MPKPLLEPVIAEGGRAKRNIELDFLQYEGIALISR
jgi:hypothetical protein